MLKLILIVFSNNTRALISQPKDFFWVTLGALLNNFLYVYGIYIIAKASLNHNFPINEIYLVSTSIVITAWGLISLFLGGLSEMAKQIEDGSLESCLISPRHPLILVAISQSEFSGIAEVTQGIAIIIYIGFSISVLLMLKTTLCILISSISLISIIIFSGSMAFYVKQGRVISSLISQSMLSMSLFPLGALLSGKELLLIFLTPLFITGYVPLMSALHFSFRWYIVGCIASLISLKLSMAFFNFGLKIYDSTSYVTLK